MFAEVKDLDNTCSLVKLKLHQIKATTQVQGFSLFDLNGLVLTEGDSKEEFPDVSRLKTGVFYPHQHSESYSYKEAGDRPLMSQSGRAAPSSTRKTRCSICLL